jgi:large subunit ribosomal protein L10
MSKYVKQLLVDGLQNRLKNVSALMLVGFNGLNAHKTHALRETLASKNIRMMVVKNSVARRATEGTSLAAGFNTLEGSYALCWSDGDVVSLAKEIVKLSKDRQFQEFAVKGAVIDGEPYDAKTAVEVSKWPTREEQISLLVGQIVGVGSTLSGQFIAAGGALASQVEKIADKEDAAA